MANETNWSWNVTTAGYDGVSIAGDNLIWYRHEHNTLAGGAAREQRIVDFLANGPALPIPPAALAGLTPAIGQTKVIRELTFSHLKRTRKAAARKR